MEKDKFEMSGEKVVLDLPFIEEVVTTATFLLANKLEEQLRKVTADLREAQIAKATNSHENYRHLSHAHTGREELTKVALQLSDAIRAQFHIVEANKRSTVLTERVHHWSNERYVRE